MTAIITEDEINSIQKVHPYFNQRMKIELLDKVKDMELLVSRSRVNDFKNWMAG